MTVLQNLKFEIELEVGTDNDSEPEHLWHQWNMDTYPIYVVCKSIKRIEYDEEKERMAEWVGEKLGEYIKTLYADFQNSKKD
jgi:hypothetical protein